MIKRINLIEKKVLNFTYQNLVQIFLAVFFLVGALIGYQFLRVKFLGPELEVEKTRLESLKVDRQSLMATPVKKKVSIGEYQGLLDQLDSVPLWSKLIREISLSLPSAVWMNNFRSVGAATAAPTGTVANIDKKDDKDSASATTSQKAETKRIEINGVSVDVKGVAEFLTKLEKSTFFSNVTLVGSQKESYGYQFTIQGDVILAYAR